MKEPFVALCREEFQFLEDEYGFRPVSTQSGEDTRHVIYKNDTTGVGVYYEFRDAATWVVLMRLLNGTLPEYGDPVNTHGLHLFVRLRSSIPPTPEQWIPPPLPPSELTKRLRKNAAALRTYADDVLHGDFSVFPELAALKRSSKQEGCGSA
jgi:hypothetical protein